MPHVLILGARAPVALDHARRFAAQGWRVSAADSVACRMTGYSHAVTACHRLPPPRFALRVFAQRLAEIITRTHVDLVLPTCEEVFYLARIRAKLPARVRVAISDFDTLAALHSKGKFLEKARASAVHAPASVYVHSLDAAREWAAGCPVVLKPEYSRFGTHTRLYPDGIPSAAPALEPAGRWLAQHYCEGLELCSYSVADRGRVLAHVVYRPTYRLRSSAGFFFVSHTDAAIDASVARLVAHTAFTGQLAMDWVQAPQGPVALECNPRATSGVHLFPPDAALPAALMGTPDHRILVPAGEQCMLAPVMWAAGLWPALRQTSLAQWQADYRRARDSLAPRGDRVPLIGALADMGAHAVSALRHLQSIRATATRDIEWNGEALVP